MTFPCTSCGACCKRVKHLDPYWPLRADDACYFLNPDNTCAIYDARPEVCRVEEMGRRFAYTQTEWFNVNAVACNQLQLEDGIGEEFRVPMTPEPTP